MGKASGWCGDNRPLPSESSPAARAVEIKNPWRDETALRQFLKERLNMPSKVRGPFIEYECSRCGSIVRENAGYRDKDREHDRIVELNNDPAKRICAGCGHEP